MVGNDIFVGELDSWWTSLPTVKWFMRIRGGNWAGQIKFSFGFGSDKSGQFDF
jgi:hypothetical protein